MRRILVVLPTDWDRRQLEACRPAWEQRFELVFAEPSDHDCPSDFDVLGFIEAVVGGAYGRLDGVMSSSDYPGATVAGAIATRLGLAGSRPETLIRSSHKYYSRLVQREAVPEATPGFALVDPEKAGRERLELGFPCFVKPVKGAFSIMARRVDSQAQLDAFLTSPGVREFLTSYVGIFNRLVRGLTRLEIDGRYFIAEELLHGAQTTVEGWSDADGKVELLGIVDSIVHPETGSFLRFEYPSQLGDAAKERMAELALRTVAALGLRSSLFNIEMIFDARRDRISILEVNPRLCGQFADLYAKVDGTSGYELALALAAGDAPSLRRGAGQHAVAASFPLRLFEPARVVRAPAAADLRAAEALFPGTLAWSECESGQTLADFETNEDGHSARYGIVNLGARDSADLLARLERIRARLGFEFARL